MLTPVLLAWTLLPRVDAGAEVAHDLGLDAALRATLEVDLDLTLFAGADWSVEAFTAVRTYVRSNHGGESPVRISPQQVHFPVGARVRWTLPGGSRWGLLAFHQSNHDVDTDDERLNRETLAYEIYGAEWIGDWLQVGGGIYYDRGTTLEGRPQTLPFQYYLAGVWAALDIPIHDVWYTALDVELVAHRNADHDIPWLNVSGHLDAGARFTGAAGRWRVFLRFERREDYQHQADEPRHLLLLGTGLGSR